MVCVIAYMCACNATVHERLLRTCDDFVWPVDTTFVGRFIIDVEFLDLKICPLNVSSRAFKFIEMNSKLMQVKQFLDM